MGKSPAADAKMESLPLREDIPLLGRWIARAFQRYWRIARGLHLSVEACVIDEADRILMIVDESGGTWELPAGTVRSGETAEFAMRRVLRVEADTEVNGHPELAFFYATGRNGQTAVFAVRHWRPLSAAPGGRIRFFPADGLPAGVSTATGERIRRCLGHRTKSEV